MIHACISRNNRCLREFQKLDYVFKFTCDPSWSLRQGFYSIIHLIIFGTTGVQWRTGSFLIRIFFWNLSRWWGTEVQKSSFQITWWYDTRSRYRPRAISRCNLCFGLLGWLSLLSMYDWSTRVRLIYSRMRLQLRDLREDLPEHD